MSEATAPAPVAQKPPQTPVKPEAKPPAQAPKAEEPVVIRVVLTEEQTDAQFVALWQRLAEKVNTSAQQHGFWEAPVNPAEKIALMHSELSEALEALRKNVGADSHIPEFNALTAELADVVIRVMDFSYQNNLPLAEAVLAKHKYNVGRPYKHGKNF